MDIIGWLLLGSMCTRAAEVQSSRINIGNIVPVADTTQFEGLTLQHLCKCFSMNIYILFSWLTAMLVLLFHYGGYHLEISW
jgi:hypothetical protein